jgi:hypothetical protein
VVGAEPKVTLFVNCVAICPLAEVENNGTSEFEDMPVNVIVPLVCTPNQYVVPAVNVNDVTAVFIPVVEQSKLALS